MHLLSQHRKILCRTQKKSEVLEVPGNRCSDTQKSVTPSTLGVCLYGSLKESLNFSTASSFHEHNRGSSTPSSTDGEGNRNFQAHSGTTSISITDQVWLLTISLGSPLTLTTGNRQKEKRWQLVSSILESSHSRGGEHVGMLRQRVQHMHIYIARHKVPNQLNFPFMVCRGNGTHTRKGWCKYAGERKKEKEEIKGEMGRKKNHKRV